MKFISLNLYTMFGDEIKYILCHLFAEDFILWLWLLWLIGSLEIFLLINVGITILAHSFTFLSTLLVA
jgi:hypothetical protein